MALAGGLLFGPLFQILSFFLLTALVKLVQLDYGWKYSRLSFKLHVCAGAACQSCDAKISQEKTYCLQMQLNTSLCGNV